jgi:CheY-like chemotaxis protein
VEELQQADEQLAVNGAEALAANNGAHSPEDEAIAARGLTPATSFDRNEGWDTEIYATLPPGARFQVLHRHLQAMGSAENSGARQQALGKFYVRIQPIVAETERAGLHSATSVGFALENLVKKLLQHPDWNTVSALSTTAAALGLFEELASSGTDKKLANPALKILVVDDDPISRRALSNALQLMFGRPDVADCGKTAVKLAAEKQYDVIFLDVLMPDMDGFETCKKIREAGTNKTAPIVFVTGENSLKARDQALGSGGNGFIPKPVLPAEIALAATTFGLTARLRQQDPADVPGSRTGKMAELAKA